MAFFRYYSYVFSLYMFIVLCLEFATYLWFVFIQLVIVCVVVHSLVMSLFL